jgi:hypothetical protein
MPENVSECRMYSANCHPGPRIKSGAGSSPGAGRQSRLDLTVFKKVSAPRSKTRRTRAGGKRIFAHRRIHIGRSRNGGPFRSRHMQHFPPKWDRLPKLSVSRSLLEVRGLSHPVSGSLFLCGCLFRSRFSRSGFFRSRLFDCRLLRGGLGCSRFFCSRLLSSGLLCNRFLGYGFFRGGGFCSRFNSHCFVPLDIYTG